jgi:hypothetical protein
LVDLPNRPKPQLWDPIDLTRGVVVSAHSVVVRGVEDRCSGSAGLGVQVTSPRGGARLATVYHEGDTRLDASRGFEVRYRTAPLNRGQSGQAALEATPSPGLSVSLALPRTLLRSASATPAAAPASWRVDWGDGASATGALPVPANLTRVYAAAGPRAILFQLFDAANGLLASTDTTVTVQP